MKELWLDVRKFEYFLFKIPDGIQTSGHISLHNKIYKFWREIWLSVFSESKSLESLDADDFFRQHYAHVITYEGEPVACSFSTFFNLNNNFTRDLGYFSSFTPDVWNEVKSRGCVKVMTVEYLTAHPEWRKERVGFSLGAVLVGLALKLARKHKVQATFGTPRKDIKANSLAEKFGFRTLLPSITKCKYECALMCVEDKEIKNYPEIETQAIIDSFWLTGKIINILESPEEKIAA